MKKLNETKIYDNLEPDEKARLMFRALINQDENELKRISESGESERWIVSNHEAKARLDSMALCALTWGIDYWQNLAQQSTALNSAKLHDDDKLLELYELDRAGIMRRYRLASLRGRALMASIKLMEQNHGMSLETVFNFAGLNGSVDEVTNGHTLMCAPADDLSNKDSEYLNIQTQGYYEKYKSFIEPESEKALH